MSDKKEIPGVKELTDKLTKTLQRPEVRLLLLGMKAQLLVEWMIDYLEKNDPECKSIFQNLDGSPVEQTRIEDLKMELKEILHYVGTNPKKEMRKITESGKKAISDAIKGNATVH